jgi:hypothetical protein
MEYDKATSTDARTANKHDKNIATAQDIPDDGPIRARNM